MRVEAPGVRVAGVVSAIVVVVANDCDTCGTVLIVTDIASGAGVVVVAWGGIRYMDAAGVGIAFIVGANIVIVAIVDFFAAAT